MNAQTRKAGLVAAAAATLAAAMLGSAAPGEVAAQGKPGAHFSTRIDNPWWPMRPGSRWVYRETDPEGARRRVVVTVLRRTKTIANGVEARVVRDVVRTADGDPVEKTYDWYAQDREGNIWYLGESTREYKNGRFTSSQGSFEAGVDGAEAGMIMPARPKVGMRYRQEYYAGEAEDKAEIFSLGERAEVPFGYFENVLMTKDLNALEPRVLEYKFYARGVGPVLAVGVSGGSDREELVSFRR